MAQPHTCCRSDLLCSRMPTAVEDAAVCNPSRCRWATRMACALIAFVGLGVRDSLCGRMGGWADGRRVEGELTSIDRTAYPRFRRSVPMKELQESFSPSESEINWARERTRTPEHLLALLLLLKAFQRLGCFPDLFEVPLSIVDHVRGVLGQASAVVAEHASSRSGERHRG